MINKMDVVAHIGDCGKRIYFEYLPEVGISAQGVVTWDGGSTNFVGFTSNSNRTNFDIDFNETTFLDDDNHEVVPSPDFLEDLVEVVTGKVF